MESTGLSDQYPDDGGLFAQARNIVDDVRAGEIKSQSELSINRLVSAVDSSLVAPHPVGNHDSVLVEVIDGRAITGVGGAAGEREVVIDGG